CEVCAKVSFVTFLHGMKPVQVKTRTDACKFNRVFQKSLPQTLAAFVKIIDAITLIKGKSVVWLIKMFEINAVDLADAYGHTFDLLFVVDQLEFVADLQPLKIHLPAEDVDEPVCELGRHAQFFHCFR